jgi:hypothetical protein
VQYGAYSLDVVRSANQGRDSAGASGFQSIRDSFPEPAQRHFIHQRIGYSCDRRFPPALEKGVLDPPGGIIIAVPAGEVEMEVTILILPSARQWFPEGDAVPTLYHLRPRDSQAQWSAV